MSLTIRPVTEADLTAVQKLAAQTFPDAAPASIPRNVVQEFIETFLTLENFRDYLASEDYLLNLAEKDGELIGYTLVDISKSHNPPEAPDAAYLSKFYLAASARGSGAAKTMMESVFAQAKQLGFKTVWLGTAKENYRSNAFYAKCGFEIIGERDFPLAPGCNGADYLRAAVIA